jgi:6-pyruvoyltetrahydropterin/6-carboxytetrahydropterin synthase
MHYSTKNYPPDLGLSCSFRQWRADSHCHHLHGYALGFRFRFVAKYLDANGWVVDFGGLKRLKAELTDRFDHRLVIAGDDPQLELFKELDKQNAAKIRIVERVGVESFAQEMFHVASSLVDNERVWCVSCECYEHDANSAIYEKGIRP